MISQKFLSNPMLILFTKSYAVCIDNAVKYTNEGSVTINITENDKKAIIKVTDTGIGIPTGKY
jgi:K+-sensing histidine kinase KdpD